MAWLTPLPCADDSAQDPAQVGGGDQGRGEVQGECYIQSLNVFLQEMGSCRSDVLNSHTKFQQKA